MTIEKNISLKNYNTFGIEAFAKEFATVSSVNELTEVLQHQKDIFVLGGGSNMLLTKNIDKLVIHINLKGIKIVQENDTHVWVEAFAGENWHEFVLWCIANDFGGIENLSLIPGNVGTTPIQNIGAYGVEIKDTMYSCEAIHRNTLELHTFTNSECHFDYRESIFKNRFKDQYIITKVTFKLTKKDHVFKTSYGAIQTELEKKAVQELSLKAVSDAVITIRESKLPNPKELGNSGSFFKNPIISLETFNTMVATYPEMPHYVVSDSTVKIPAGWLIEQCGFKGKRYGDAGIHSNQALVLVNYGNATGSEIYDLSKKIQNTIYDRFGIAIEAEVNII